MGVLSPVTLALERPSAFIEATFPDLTHSRAARRSRARRSARDRETHGGVLEGELDRPHVATRLLQGARHRGCGTSLISPATLVTDLQ
jgi:hypothetical protein